MNLEKINNIKNKVFDTIFPRFDELSVFLLLYLTILMLVFNKQFLSDFLLGEIYGDMLPGVLFNLIFIVFFIIGVPVSLFHVCVNWKKGKIGLYILKFNGLFINGMVGIKGGLYAFSSDSRLLVVFPIWNILLGISSLYALAVGVEEFDFDHLDAAPKDVFLGLLSVTILFILFNNCLGYYWALTFSICTTYSYGLNRKVISAIDKLKFNRL